MANPSNNKNLYLHDKGKTYGPYTGEEIEAMRRQNRLPQTAQFAEAGSNNWRPIGTFALGAATGLMAAGRLTGAVNQSDTAVESDGIEQEVGGSGGGEHYGSAETVTADMNADGVTDAVGVDTNNDGFIDTVGVDSNQDGYIDGVAIDSDHDGVIDAVGVDTDYDGDIDAVGLDTNNDGVIDAVGVDTNNDGVIDTVGVDTNNDGVIDAVGVDTDYDGDIDAGAVDTDFDGDFDMEFDDDGEAAGGLLDLLDL